MALALGPRGGDPLEAYAYEPYGKLWDDMSGFYEKNYNGYDKDFDNPIRYAGQYYDTETGFYYLRARYYDPDIKRFISEDTHWNINNMIYGDSEDAKYPDYSAILQSSNLYAYAMNNPVMYVDINGEMAIVDDLIYILIGVVILVPTMHRITQIASSVHFNKNKHYTDSVLRALAFMAFAGSVATPPPPNKGGKGTQVKSKTLYEEKGKNGFRVDVENPGNRQGQVHLQFNSDPTTRYIYNVQDGSFHIKESTGEVASRAIQKYLEKPEVIEAIAKGLKYLGY